MFIYIGYGFNVKDLTDDAIFEFVKRFRPDLLKEYKEQSLTKKKSVNTKKFRVYLDFCEEYIGLAELIAKTINEVCHFNLIYSDNYVLYNGLHFYNDFEKLPSELQVIKDRKDIPEFLSNYINLSGVKFGEIYVNLEDFLDIPYSTRGKKCSGDTK